MFSFTGTSEATEASPLVDGEASSSSSWGVPSLTLPSLTTTTTTEDEEGGGGDGEDHVAVDVGEGQQEIMVIAMR